MFSQTPKSSGGFCPPVCRAVFKCADDLILLRQNRAPRCCFGQRVCCGPYRRYLRTDVLTQRSFFFKLKGRKVHKTELYQLLKCYFIWSREIWLLALSIIFLIIPRKQNSTLYNSSQCSLNKDSLCPIQLLPLNMQMI